ncbi:23S rRNA (pseudouridine(1915)-N(3))-methyltransferase RlmH [Haematomicrobium sanguinis]|uniref:23S rRNA (pseudouridine(1915)-N(3))-methyltransferase RlmH n=1 Tax=Haematomicrobium sanguinis TaxID=479106 RepID=UPI00047C1873|nr:23S rRNA (pseudouridine(1915)-N(3))-methyltransferase RlmH [Haematomicrobium sanguinis]
MSLRALAIGRKHEDWVSDGIARFEKRLKKPWDLTWQLVPHSNLEYDGARQLESEKLASKAQGDYLILLDERGKAIDSPSLSARVQGQLDLGKRVSFVIGGAYGVTDEFRNKADFVWSLSPLVFPHQLVRLILAEQVYRAQEIAAGRPYHHE